MKKITFILSLLLSMYATAQDGVLLYEADFEDEDAVDEWTVLDEDGDGLSWSIVTIIDQNENPVAGPLLRSASWDASTGQPLNPDNWAITPSISIPAGDDDVTLRWEVSSADAEFADENYTVYVATSNDVNDFMASDVTFNELVTDNGPGGLDNVYQKTLDISSFAGQDVFVAFRHHDVSDEFTIELHSVEVFTGTLSNAQFVEENAFVQYINSNKLFMQANVNIENAQIFDMSGRRVANERFNKNNNVSVDLNDLPNGTYIVRVAAENGNHSFKIVR